MSNTTPDTTPNITLAKYTNQQRDKLRAESKISEIQYDALGLEPDHQLELARRIYKQANDLILMKRGNSPLNGRKAEDLPKPLKDGTTDLFVFYGGCDNCGGDNAHS